jgi:hypothetical protein
MIAAILHADGRVQTLTIDGERRRISFLAGHDFGLSDSFHSLAARSVYKDADQRHDRSCRYRRSSGIVPQYNRDGAGDDRR